MTDPTHPTKSPQRTEFDVHNLPRDFDVSAPSRHDFDVHAPRRHDFDVFARTRHDFDPYEI
jgi:hypothetical protein